MPCWECNVSFREDNQEQVNEKCIVSGVNVVFHSCQTQIDLACRTEK